MMDDSEEIILLTLILGKRCRKREHFQNLDFVSEMRLSEENSVVNFIGKCKSRSLVFVVKKRVFI